MKHFIKTHIKAAAAIIGGFILALALGVTLPLTLPRDEKASPNTSTAVTTPEGNWIDYRDTSISENWATSTTLGQTEDTAIEISTPEQLAKLAYDVNNVANYSDYKFHYFKLTANIDLSAHYWTPIGDGLNIIEDSYKQTDFIGSFNGQNHTITGINISSDVTIDGSYGLFGQIHGLDEKTAEIKNLGIIDCEINCQDEYWTIGAIAGCGAMVTISNCMVVNGSINAKDVSVGGIIGYHEGNVDIINCYNSASISCSGSAQVGGILAADTGTANVINCYNSGTIKTDSGEAGGIIGYSNPYKGHSNIVNCYNLGEISGQTEKVGGIAGCIGDPGRYEYTLYITNCYSTYYGASKILGSESTPYDPVITNSGNVTNLKYLVKSEAMFNVYSEDSESNVSYNADDGSSGRFMWAESVMINDVSTNVKWDFENTWMIDSRFNDGYPILRFAESYYEAEYQKLVDTYWILNAADSYAEGSGDGSSEDQAILIETPEQLAKFASDYSGDLEGVGYKYYKLMADINLSGKIWTPIGESVMKNRMPIGFEGVFDGNGHVISNFEIENTESMASLGLFGWVGNSEHSSQTNIIKNLGVKGSTVSYEPMGSSDNAAYVGSISGGAIFTEFSNCYAVDCKFVTRYGSGGSGGAYIGGIVGLSSNCTIKHCYTSFVNPEMTESVLMIMSGIAISMDITITDCFADLSKVTSIQNSDQTPYLSGIAAAVGGTLTVTNSYYYAGDTNLNKTCQSFDLEGITINATNSGKVEKADVFTDAKNFGVEAFGSYTDDDGQAHEGEAKWSAAWDFENLWGIAQPYNSGYPVFRSGYWILNAADSYAGGNGSEQSPFEISSAEELALLAKQVNESAGKFTPQHFVLTKDIDLSGKIWTPIGENTLEDDDGTVPCFYGHFDGQNHIISGMTLLIADHSYDELGLFGSIGSMGNIMMPMMGLLETVMSGQPVDDATIWDLENFDWADLGGESTGKENMLENSIKNLIVKDTYVNQEISGSTPSLGIISCVVANTLVENCKTVGAVEFNGSSCYLGGIVYSAGLARIKNCLNTANLNFENTSETVGMVYNCYFCEIDSCFNTGDIMIAGICGMSLGCNITNCVNTGNVISKYSYKHLGGIIAGGSDIKLENCVNLGNITQNRDVVQAPGSDAYYIGGLVGAVGGTFGKTTHITACYSESRIESNCPYVIGGIIGGAGVSGDPFTPNCKVLINDSAFFGTIYNSYDGATNNESFALGGMIGYYGGEAEGSKIDNSHTVFEIHGVFANGGDEAFVQSTIGALSSSQSVEFGTYYAMGQIRGEERDGGAVQIDPAQFNGDFANGHWFMDMNFLNGNPTLKALYWIGANINNGDEINNLFSELEAA